jgi:hypothetical protein
VFYSVKVIPMHSRGDELKEFCMVLRRALLMVIRWIESRYDLSAGPRDLPRDGPGP